MAYLRIVAAFVPPAGGVHRGRRRDYVEITDEGCTMLIGLDVGGTHTDAVLVDKNGIAASSKVPTVHDNLLESINAVIAELLKSCRPGQIERINLSTTLSTNAIVEGTIESVGVIVSAGPGIDPGEFRIGNHYFAVNGSIDHRGTEILPVAERQEAAALKDFVQAGLKVFAVAGKFSTRNQRHENEMAARLGKKADFVTRGHMLSGRLNFPRRVVSAYYNSAVWRQYNRFAAAIEESLARFDLNAPITILKADGGTMPLAMSKNIPVESILSGPAASVMGIVALCEITEDAVMLDIGGTTTDIAIFAGGAPLIEPDGIGIMSRQTLVRALRTRSIGIGGDSHLTIENGEVRVGPERRGLSMADGGRYPALIDALNVAGIAGYGNTGRSAEGIKMLADRSRMDPKSLAVSAVDYAIGKIRSEVESLVDEINDRPVYTIHEMLEGRKITPKGVYVVGGPARVFSASISKALGMMAMVPEHYEVANAVGAGLARTTMYLELHADTEKGKLLIPEIDVVREITGTYSLDEAEKDVKRYLVNSMKSMEGGDRFIHAEIVDSAIFNMVRGFSTTGKNIRVKCQVKPGVLNDYVDVLRKKC